MQPLSVAMQAMQHASDATPDGGDASDATPDGGDASDATPAVAMRAMKPLLWRCKRCLIQVIYPRVNWKYGESLSFFFGIFHVEIGVSLF